MNRGIVVFLIPLILSIGIAPSIPFSDAQETLDNIYRDDSMTECRDGQWLVMRIPQNNYVCTLDTTGLSVIFLNSDITFFPDSYVS